MAKGNVCIVCKKVVEEHWDTGKIINGMPRIYCVDCMKCRDCQRKFKEDEEIVITSGDKYLQCEECSKKHKHEKKCDECKIEVAYHHIQGTGIKGTLSLCDECNKKRNDKDKPNDKGDKKHTCPGCHEEYSINILDDKVGNDTFKCLMNVVDHQKSDKKCFWDSPEIKAKVQEYRNRFSKYFDYTNNPNGFQIKRDECSLEELQQCKKELLNIPPVDDLVVLKAFFYGLNHPVTPLGCPAKSFLIQNINSSIEKKQKEPIPNKKPSKDKQSKPDEVCERCGVSCKELISTDKEKGTQTYRITRKRITHYYTDFRKTVNYFGMNCPCAEEFKKEHQQTCPQCNKTEWPDMKKGWMLDYEIHKAFCSPICHVTYRQLKWEAENLTVEMMPPELELSTNEGQNTDWGKEGLKREVLYWREYARELEQRLNNQTNLTPEERQQSNYLRRLQQNTLRRAEDNYQSRYGSLVEDGSNKGMSGGIIFLIIGVVALVAVAIGVIIYSLTKKNDKKRL